MLLDGGGAELAEFGSCARRHRVNVALGSCGGEHGALLEGETGYMRESGRIHSRQSASRRGGLPWLGGCCRHPVSCHNVKALRARIFSARPYVHRITSFVYTTRASPLLAANMSAHHLRVSSTKCLQHELRELPSSNRWGDGDGDCL